MKTNSIKSDSVGVFILLLLVFGLSACNTGLLQTVEQNPLVSKIKKNNLVLVLHGIVNYRSEIYLCLYDTDGGSLNATPLKQYNSSGGIPYGQLSAVQFPENLPSHALIVYMKSTIESCPPREPDELEFEEAIGTALYHESDSEISFYAISGYLPKEKGGEDWTICGENGDESCESYLDRIGFGSGSFLPLGPLYDKTKIRPDTELLIDLKGPSGGVFDEPYTICWNENDSGDASPMTVCNRCEDYAPPWGYFNVEPMTEGLISVYKGDTNCETAVDSEAMATLELPAEYTFGDHPDTIAFGSNTVGYIFLVGVYGDNVPPEAAPRIVVISIPGFESDSI